MTVAWTTYSQNGSIQGRSIRLLNLEKYNIIEYSNIVCSATGNRYTRWMLIDKVIFFLSRKVEIFFVH